MGGCVNGNCNWFEYLRSCQTEDERIEAISHCHLTSFSKQLVDQLVHVAVKKQETRFLVILFEIIVEQNNDFNHQNDYQLKLKYVNDQRKNLTKEKETHRKFLIETEVRERRMAERIEELTKELKEQRRKESKCREHFYKAERRGRERLKAEENRLLDQREKNLKLKEKLEKITKSFINFGHSVSDYLTFLTKEFSKIPSELDSENCSNFDDQTRVNAAIGKLRSLGVMTHAKEKTIRADLNSLASPKKQKITQKIISLAKYPFSKK